MAAAQARLQELQAQSRARREAAGQTRPDVPTTGWPAAFGAEPAAPRPPPILSAQQILEQRRRAYGFEPVRITADLDEAARYWYALAEEARQALSAREAGKVPPAAGVVDSPGVRHYPALGTAALQARLSAAYQVWLLCHLLDPRGSGLLSIEDLRQQLTREDSRLRLFTWKRLKQVLRAGEGIFWHRHVAGKLRLNGARRVAANLGVEHLSGLPVYFGERELTAGRGEFNAHLGAAWHSGQRHSRPVSQKTIRKLTGVPERSQRRYNKAAGVQVQPNVAIVGPLKKEEEQERAYQYGRAVFRLTDYEGKLGPPGRCYIAQRLPNSYTGPHQQAPKGRQRAINRYLSNLVNNEGPGKREMRIDRNELSSQDSSRPVRLFFDNGADAARSRSPVDHDLFWQSHKKTKAGGVIWHTIRRQ